MSKQIKLSKSILKLSLGFSLIPVQAFAFSLSSSNFGEVVAEIISVVRLISPLLITTAFIVFFWGLSKFIFSSGNEKEIQNGKNYMFWGIIILFVLLTFRAIVGLIASDLEIGDSSIIPQLPDGTRANVTTSETFTLPDTIISP